MIEFLYFRKFIFFQLCVVFCSIFLDSLIIIYILREVDKKKIFIENLLKIIDLD